MRGTNCKICKYSLNIRNIVDFLPEIPSGIRKLNFQSWFERKYHFHRGKKREGKFTTFLKTLFLAEKLGSGKSPGFAEFKYVTRLLIMNIVAGQWMQTFEWLTYFPGKFISWKLRYVLAQEVFDILYITEVCSSIHRDNKAPRGLMLERLLLTFFRADM